MSKKIFLTIALAVASAFALTVAAPAYACGGDCDCAKKAGAEKKGDKPADKKVPEKKASLDAQGSTLLAAGDAKKCECEKGGKGCICAKGECKCANCGKADKLAAGDAKKCECEKGGKNCTCPKGECKCANCGKGEKKSA